MKIPFQPPQKIVMPKELLHVRMRIETCQTFGKESLFQMLAIFFHPGMAEKILPLTGDWSV